MVKYRRGLAAKLDDVAKGDLVKFEISGRESGWYLVREAWSYHTSRLWDGEPDFGKWIALAGKRGGLYYIAWTRSEGPWLYYTDRRGNAEDRTRIKAIEHRERDAVTPSWLGEYIDDAHMLDAWPDV